MPCVLTWKILRNKKGLAPFTYVIVFIYYFLLANYSIIGVNFAFSAAALLDWFANADDCDGVGELP